MSGDGSDDILKAGCTLIGCGVVALVIVVVLCGTILKVWL